MRRRGIGRLTPAQARRMLLRADYVERTVRDEVLLQAPHLTEAERAEVAEHVRRSLWLFAAQGRQR